MSSMQYDQLLGVRIVPTTWMSWDEVCPGTRLSKKGVTVTRCKLRIRDGMNFQLNRGDSVETPRDKNKILLVDFFPDGTISDRVLLGP